MKIKFNVKSNTIAVYCIIVFSVCLLLAAMVFKYNIFLSYFNKIISVLSPVIWGLVIAYLLNPIMKFIERIFDKFIFKKKEHPKISRSIGIAVSLIIMLGIVIAIVGSIVPEIIGTIKNIFMNITSYLNNLQNYLNDKISDTLESNPRIKEFLNSEFNNIQDFIISAVNQYQPKLDSFLAKDGILANLTDSAWSLLNGLKNCVLGIIISIYLLYSKETLIAQCKKVVYAMFSEKKRVHILTVASRANSTFSNFLSGKALDSLIIGVLCFLGMIILNMKTYAVLIGVIVGVTNMIPFFGPFIGAIPSGLLILLTTPNKTLIFIIFIFLLQQFDGNILGPKILGNSLGLSSFWIMFAIFVGGGLFGFAGMIAFVPLFAVLYSIFSEIIAVKLHRKKLPVETEYYKTTAVQPESAAVNLKKENLDEKSIEKTSAGSDKTEKPDKK